MLRYFFLLALASGVWLGTAFAQQEASYALDTLTLAQAQALLLKHNRDLHAAHTALTALKADVVTAGERPNPSLSVNTSSINLDSGLGNGGVWDKHMDTVVRVDQLLERGNKRGLRLASANALTAAQTASNQDLLRQLRASLTDRYSDLLLAQERERIGEQTLALYRRSVQASTLRLKAGDIAVADLARIQVDAARAEGDLRQARVDRGHAQLALAAMLGIEAQATAIHAADPWPGDIGVAPSAATPQVVEQRPDVQAAALRVQAAESARDLARAQQTRDVSVGIQYEHDPPDGRNLLGVGFSVPLLVNHQYQGEIARAEADLQVARDEAGKVRAQALSELLSADADLRAARDRREIYQSGVVSAAQRAADAAEFAFQQGASSVTDLLDARRTLHATLLDAANAQADYAKALAAWRSARNIEDEP